MSRTTLTDYETQEREVIRSGHKWEVKDTEWDVVEVEKEGLVCDCCPRIIGPVDDPEPHATLMANPTVYGTERFDETAIIDGERLKRKFKDKFNNGLRSSSDRINAYSARHSSQNLYHKDWEGSVKFTGDTPAGGEAIFTRAMDIQEVLQETLDDVMPHAFDGSTNAFKTDAELHFCESCAEEFGLETTTGIEETVEERESEEHDSQERTAVLLGKNGVEKIIHGTMVLVGTFMFTHVFLGTPAVEVYDTMLNSPGFVHELFALAGGSGIILAAIISSGVVAAMMLPAYGTMSVAFGVGMVAVCVFRMWFGDDN